MRKVFIVSILSFLFLTIASIVTYILKFIVFKNAWMPLIIGVAILSASGVLAIFGKRKLWINIVCFTVSGIALGFCIRSWYAFRKFDNGLGVLTLVSLCCVLYLWIVFALSRLKFARNHPTLFVIIVTLLSLTAYVLLVVFTKTTYVSTFGYYMIIEIAFLFAMFSSTDDEFELFRKVTLSTYSVFVVAIIIVIMLLSGEGGDVDFDLSGIDLDFNIGSSNGKKTKKK